MISKFRILIALITATGLLSCSSSRKTTSNTKKFPAFFKVGHRGTRGLMPENTIPAMEKGIEVGANTVEMDVHISKDGKVLVYHDESFDPKYTTMPDGSDISKSERKKYTFYQMNYDEIRKFIIGKKEYPAFSQQQRLATYTPLLSELIDSVDAYTKAHNLPGVYYLIEIKSNEKTDGFEQPAPEEYMKILMDVLEQKNLGNRLFLQSFDMRPLQVLHREYPKIKLGFLTGDKTKSFEENLDALGFTPFFYNPSSNLGTPELIKKCHDKSIKIEPWTVNTAEEISKLKSEGVDGIITDYPNLLQQ
jgi:glycerophosphoryl diester phosphodiesterase